MTDAATSEIMPGNLGEISKNAKVLAVVAHPDDESFGLGAVLAGLANAGNNVRVLCLTHGEASTLGVTADLGEIRRAELARAATRLGILEVELDDFPDGRLADVAPDVLDDAIERRVGDAALLVVFEPGGVTGHRDHIEATAAGERVAARHGLSVIEWGVSPAVAATLNAELGTGFVSLEGDGVVEVRVERTGQLDAIACHESQTRDNPVLTRRLELQADRERVRLRGPCPTSDDSGAT